MLDIVMLSRRLRLAGRAVRLRNAQPQVWRVIEMVGLLRLPGIVLEGPAPAMA